MGATTQRMLERSITVDNVTATVLWGDAEDGVLNGGTSLCTSFDNTDPANAVTVSIWVQATIDAPFIANTATVPCPANTKTRIDITGIVGYAARLTGLSAAAPVVAKVAVQVQQ